MGNEIKFSMVMCMYDILKRRRGWLNSLEGRKRGVVYMCICISVYNRAREEVQYCAI